MSRDRSRSRERSDRGSAPAGGDSNEELGKLFVGNLSFEVIDLIDAHLLLHVSCELGFIFSEF